MARPMKIQGIECPFIREGDDLAKIVIDAVLKETEIDWSFQDRLDAEHLDYELPKYRIQSNSVIGITESAVARAKGQYITVTDIANDIIKKYGKDATIGLLNPIYSRNRFALILRGIARGAKKLVINMPFCDEVGNIRDCNQFTNVNMEEHYKNICKEENCECEVTHDCKDHHETHCIHCGLHDFKEWKNAWGFDRNFTLADICSDVSPDWGVLGTNAADGERLKLFPSKAEAQRICDEVKAGIKKATGKDVIVCIYGDGCFKDPVGEIWEFADPVTMPAYSDKELIESSPNEYKLKYLIDSKVPDEVINTMHVSAVDNANDKLGTTPRIHRDILASIMDLTSGSGDRGTPVVLIQNYF